MAVKNYIGKDRLKDIAELTKDELDKRATSYTYDEQKQKLTISGGLSGGDNAKHTYSTEEQVIGKWINGKPLYEITYPIELRSTQTTISLDGVISDLEMIASCNIMGNGYNWYYMSGYDYLRHYVDGNSIIIMSGSTYPGLPIISNLVIQYTKTTD